MLRRNYEMETLFRLSSDETVGFSMRYISGVMAALSHNINGRDVYVDGTLYDAIPFVQKKIDAGEKGKAYTMVDISKEK